MLPHRRSLLQTFLVVGCEEIAYMNNIPALRQSFFMHL